MSSEIITYLQPLGFFLLCLLCLKYNKFLRFAGFAPFIIIYILYFLLLVSIEIYLNDLPLADCDHPWGVRVSNEFVSAFCISRMISPDFNISSDERISRGRNLKPLNYNVMIETICLQGLILAVPIFCYMQCDLPSYLVTLYKRLTEARKKGQEEEHIFRRTVKLSFDTNTNSVGKNIVLYEIGSLIFVLGNIIFMGNFLQNNFSISVNTWMFGLRIFSNCPDEENLFPSRYPCPAMDQDKFVNDAFGQANSKAPYFYCHLTMMKIYKQFFGIYWVLLMLQAFFFIYRFFSRLILVFSFESRKLELQDALMKFSWPDADTRRVVEDYCAEHHYRFVFLMNVVGLFKRRDAQKVLTTLIPTCVDHQLCNIFNQLLSETTEIGDIQIVDFKVL